MRRSWRSIPVALTMALAVGLPGGPATATRTAPVGDAAGSSAAAVERTGSAGFASPEDAVREYLAGVADADVDRILGATAIDEMSDGYRFDLLTERIGAFMPQFASAPADYPFYADINSATLSSRILNQALMLAYSLLTDIELNGAPITGVDSEWADEFVTSVDPARLSGLTIVDIRFSDAAFEADPRYLAVAEEQAVVYGADEQTERLVLFEFGGQLYDVGFTLLRYRDAWKVSSQAAPLGGTSALGTARRTSVEGYDLQTLGE